jgi:NOL1/NOP2/fmu family ribosome biogenesis protein
MQNLKILNSKEKKQILSLIEKQWDAKLNLDYVFLQNEKKNKIYMVNKDISKIDASKIRINSLGLYLGELRNNEMRLSIEGSQLVGPKAKKNIIEIDNPREWIKGNDLETEETANTFVIIKNGNDFYGCGKIKEGRIFNFVSKNRRINVSD